MRGIILGTGPSVTKSAIALLNKTRLPIYGCNNAYQVAPLAALLSCNPEWWDYYWPRDEKLRDGEFSKWTWDRATANKYGLSYIQGSWGNGLSKDPKIIHYGHSSGYQLLNLALHHGITEMVLIGYDLRYPPGYSKTYRDPGGERHFFGEYPKELEHWPSVCPNGEMVGLLDCYRTIDTNKYGIRIINCSPGTALDFFETGRLEDYV